MVRIDAPAVSAPLFRAVALLILLVTGSPGFAGEVRIAVAANFTDTTHALITAFETRTGHRASASFGSTGKLYAQIRNGAPFDVFLAADARRPRLLEKEGRAVAGTRFTYAIGKLALWTPEPHAFEKPEAFLSSPALARVAIANPKTAPYGLAARQALKSMNLWDSLQHRIVRGDSIAQAFQFIASGNAGAGFVALSQIKSWDGQAGTQWLVPQSYYAPLEQQAVLLDRGKTNPAAQAWLDFLKSPEATGIIQGYGYEGVQ